ncbi:MAG: DUF2098 domain-containing protein [Candidatus Methanoperedenaceae archaeon]|nr:DUF2098 domain-containing protein [Euryarchaeota archaeon]MCG2727211.1 DUF2098 domain-containing protein [Candidatus Methanoperedenaceae archaeon]
MGEIEVCDSAGNPMHTGSFVLYAPTGTKGDVVEIMSDEEGTWALVDKTNLFYKTEVLTVIRKVEEKELGEKLFTREEVSDKLEKEKEAVPAEMSDVSVESGG